MQELIDFLTNPYKEATTFDISLEVIAAIFGIISVIFQKRAKVALYPTGMVSTLIYIYICWNFSLYGDFLINIYYSIMSVYGWILWTRPQDGVQLEITRSTTKDWSITFGIFLSTALLVTAVYLYFDRFDRFTDYTDTLTTGIFFAAMWMLANKKTEHWILWIVANSISIPLYLFKGLGFTAIQYSVFLVLAIQGWYIWQKNLKKKI